MIEIHLTATGFDDLSSRFRVATVAGTRNALERASELTRAEMPTRQGRLKAGLKTAVTLAGKGVTGTLRISALSSPTGGTGTLITASGRRRNVSLRGGRPFDYAPAVAFGTGVDGPKRTPVKPRRSRVLLIPVGNGAALTGESYLLVNGVKYIFRRRVKGVRPNAFHERAAARLRQEITAVYDAALNEAVN